LAELVTIDPVAMSVRATNVYEEQSLGVFELEKSNDMNPEGDVDKARAPFDTPGRVVIWGKYLSTHAKDLLSFGMCLSLRPLCLFVKLTIGYLDMWSLALAVFVVCWIEVSLVWYFQLMDVSDAVIHSANTWRILTSGSTSSRSSLSSYLPIPRLA